MNEKPLHACALRAFLGACLVGLLTGCGPVQAATAISDGTRALEQADRFDAESFARYEYTKARLLLTEAKRRNGFGDYEIARQWADEAAGLALEASRTARARRELERRKRRTQPDAPPKVEPPTPTQKAPDTAPDKTGPDERRPIKPPERRQILPPGQNKPGGGQ